jgi:hypothetical protein
VSIHDYQGVYEPREGAHRGRRDGHRAAAA